MHKQIMACPLNGVLDHNKKEQMMDICNRDESAYSMLSKQSQTQKAS